MGMEKRKKKMCGWICPDGSLLYPSCFIVTSFEIIRNLNGFPGFF